jgi:hypothetical protein
MYGEFGYAAAYVHLFYVLSCVERCRQVRSLTAALNCTVLRVSQSFQANSVTLP